MMGSGWAFPKLSPPHNRPLYCCLMEALGSFWSRPQCDTLQNLPSIEGDRGMEIDCKDAANACFAEPQCFFRIVQMRPSNAKQVFLHPGARQRVSHNAIAISMLQAERVSEDEWLLDVASPVVAESADDVSFLYNVGADFDCLRAGFKVWNIENKVVLGIRDQRIQHSAGISELVTSLVEASAVPGGKAWMPKNAELQFAISELQRCGFLQGDGDAGWLLTVAGLSATKMQLRAVTPHTVCNCRSGMRLADMTRHELLEKLNEQGFCWQMIPRGKRRNALKGYAPGLTKVCWYSSASLSRQYMMALLTAEDTVFVVNYDTLCRCRCLRMEDNL